MIQWPPSPTLDLVLQQSALRLPPQEPGVLEFEVIPALAAFHFFHVALDSFVFCSGMLQTPMTHPHAHRSEVNAPLNR